MKTSFAVRVAFSAFASVFLVLVLAGLLIPSRAHAQGCGIYWATYDDYEALWTYPLADTSFRVDSAFNVVHVYTYADHIWLTDLYENDSYVASGDGVWTESTNEFSLEIPSSCFPSSTSTPSPTFEPTVTPTPTVVIPSTYTPTYCDADFETCYGDSFGKFLLLFFALITIFIVGSRQRVLLGIAFVFAALLLMPLAVFGFWFFVSTLIMIIADMLVSTT